MDYKAYPDVTTAMLDGVNWEFILAGTCGSRIFDKAGFGLSFLTTGLYELDLLRALFRSR